MLLVLVSVIALFHLFYFVALLKKDFSIIDTAWGLAFLTIFISSYFAFPVQKGIRELVLGALILVWALRLSGYIFYRSLKTGKEDYRYAAWREEWGEKANITAYFRVYWLQTVLALLTASHLIVLNAFESQAPFGNWKDFLGLTFWVIGFFFEAVGDFQKNRFKSDPQNKGRVMTSGLWRYTRHPNYFGEALLWWGSFFICLNHAPFYFVIWGPLLLHFFLLKVSGVAMLERKYEGNEEFSEYAKQTNSFLPWFPKKL